MAWVETRITRTTQPQDAVGIDTTYSKLKFASTLGVSTRNEVNGRPNTWTSPNLVVTQKGYAAKFNGTSSFIQLPTSNLVAGDTVTLSFWANMTGATGVMACFVGSTYTALIGILSGKGMIFEAVGRTTNNQGVATASIPSGLVHVTYVSGPTESAVYFNGQRQTLTNLVDGWGAPPVGNHSIGSRRNGSTPQFFNGTLSDFCVFEGALSQEEITANYQNPWAIFEPEVTRFWIDDTVSAGGAATVIPIGVQATGSVGTPIATGAATVTPAGVSASSAVGTPIAVGGASIPATVLPVGVQATAAVGTVSATGAAVALPAGVTASSAVGAPAAVAGTSIPATVLPAGVQAASAVGTPTVTAAAIAQPLGVAAIAYVGTPTIATGVSGVAVAYPAGVAAIGQVGTLIATGAAWTAAVGVQAVGSVGTPFAYEGVLVSYTAGAQTRPSRLQSSSRPGRIQTGSRASR